MKDVGDELKFLRLLLQCAGISLCDAKIDPGQSWNFLNRPVAGRISCRESLLHLKSISLFRITGISKCFTVFRRDHGAPRCNQSNSPGWSVRTQFSIRSYAIEWFGVVGEGMNDRFDFSVHDTPPMTPGRVTVQGNCLGTWLSQLRSVFA
jgi:hypothetical protein